MINVRRFEHTNMELPYISAPEIPLQLDLKLDYLMQCSQEIKRELFDLGQQIDSYTHQFNEYHKSKVQAQQLHSMTSTEFPESNLYSPGCVEESMLNQQVPVMVRSHAAIVCKVTHVLTSLDHIQTRILNCELVAWKREQQLHGNGAEIATSLDKIQEWCEKFLEIIFVNRHNIKEEECLKLKLILHSPEIADSSKRLQEKITRLLSTLVTSTFVIEKQPMQVVKTHSKVTTTLRFLLGGKLNLIPNLPKVTATIVNEVQANSLLMNNAQILRDSSGELLNNTEIMQYNETTKQMFVTFTKMQLKKIKRAEKKGTECVMDEKFSLLFQSQFSIGEGLIFQVWTFSLPVVVVVHGSQDPYAWATITWDNAFCDPGRRPFEVPLKEYWPRIAETINMKFKGATGSSLSIDALNFLAQKAFRAQYDDYSEKALTFTKFCKDTLPDRNFTFWEWFYAAMKLTREHLRDLWKDGLIMGFIMKKKAEEMLSQCRKGTFLLRFSDSELGGITIAWVGERREVYMLQPFTNKDFAIRSLPDRISDLPSLMFLYSGVPKDQAFGKFYTPFNDTSTTSVNGYVKPLLVTHVPGLNESSTFTYLDSPQFYQFSPRSGDTGFPGDPSSSPNGSFNG